MDCSAPPAPLRKRPCSHAVSMLASRSIRPSSGWVDIPFVPIQCASNASHRLKDSMAPKKGESLYITVSKALSSTRRRRLHHFHNLQDYAAAFEGFEHRVSGVLGGGTDCVVLRLEDGNVLKITTHDLPVGLGERVFDLPVLERGFRSIEERQINYFVQPFAQAAKRADLHSVGKLISASGYHFQEPFLDQIGRYQGSPRLLDPWAARRVLSE